MMDFAALASFNRVAKHGGFSQASRATGQPKATLSRHVRELESDLGFRLVERSSRSLRLTDEGVALHARTEGLLAELEEVGADVGADLIRPRGRLRVSVPVLFADVMMGRIGADFIARFPEILLEVTADDRSVDLIAEGYDAVVRINPKPTSDLVGQCILEDRTMIVAPASFPRPSSSVRGKLLELIPAITLSSGSDAAIWEDFVKIHGQRIPTRTVLRLPSFLVARDAVRAGAGIALLPESVVAEDLAVGRLASWGVARDRKVEVWVLHNSRRLVSRKVTALVSFLKSTFQHGMP